MPSPLLLDTCALIWIANGERVSDDALEAVRNAEQADNLLVSAISAWEIATLASKGRLRLTLSPESWFATALESTSLTLAELTVTILVHSAALPGSPPGDPADRMIIATARETGSTIVTRDRKILGYADEGWVCALPC